MAEAAVSDVEADLNNLTMGDQAQPLLDAVTKFIAADVEPRTEEYFEAAGEHGDRWSLSPRQETILGGLKNKAKSNGLWNFFLPDADTGEGLKNLDYAYIAAQLGKKPHRVRVPELQRAGHRQHGSARTLRQRSAEGKVAEATPERRDPFGLRDDRAEPRLVRRQADRHAGAPRRRRVGDHRREVLHLRRRRQPLQGDDHDGADGSDGGAAPAAVADSRAHRQPRRRDHRADGSVRPRRRPPRPHASQVQRRARAEGEHPPR